MSTRWHTLRYKMLGALHVVIILVLGFQLVVPRSILDRWINPPGSKLITDYSIYGYVLIVMGAVLACAWVSSIWKSIRSADGGN